MSGRFKQAGLNVQVLPYPNMPSAVKDLLGGKLHAEQLTLPLFLALKAGKGPVDSPKPVVATQVTGTEGGAIVVKGDSSIKDVKQLEGLKIASHTKFTVHYMILAALMEKRNFTEESIQNIRVRPLHKMLPALGGGEIEAFIMPEPVNSMAAFKKLGQVLVKTNALWAGHPCCLTASTGNFTQDNPELYQAFTDVMVKTGLDMDSRDTRDEMMGILRKSAPYSKLPPQVLASALSNGISGFRPFPFTSSFLAAKIMMKDRGLLDGDSLPGEETGIDYSFANKAYSSLGGQTPNPMKEEKVVGKVLV